MTKTLVLALSVVATVGLLGGAEPATACDYDILAMCCTETNDDGKCTRWQNCCSLKTPSSDREDTSPTGPAFVAERRCVQSCNRRSRSVTARDACYSSCARRPIGRLRLEPPNRRGIGSGPGGFESIPEAGSYLPTFAQVGSSSASVPMEHGSCGLDCSTHVLAVRNGNLDVKVAVGMTCRPDRQVDHLSFKPAGHNATTVVAAATGSSSYSSTLFAQPFSTSELEQTCRQALGGSWGIPGPHNNRSKIVKKTIKKTVEVWGRCTGWTNKAKRSYPVTLTVSCIDQSWFTPVP